MVVFFFKKKCRTLLSFAGIQAGQDPVINFKVIIKCRRRQAGPIPINGETANRRCNSLCRAT
jgi:hypothetical protein